MAPRATNPLRKAMLVDGIVAQVWNADPDFYWPWMDELPWLQEGAGIGSTYDPETDTFGPPAPVVPDPITTDQVNEERDRRLGAGFDFNGHHFDSDRVSMQRITGAATMAGFWITAGNDPASLFWHGGTEPFRWITADNSIITMDAQTALAFGQAAALHESNLIFAARVLKDMDPIPQDYAEDQHWP